MGRTHRWCHFFLARYGRCLGAQKISIEHLSAHKLSFGIIAFIASQQNSLFYFYTQYALLSCCLSQTLLDESLISLVFLDCLTSLERPKSQETEILRRRDGGTGFGGSLFSCLAHQAQSSQRWMRYPLSQYACGQVSRTPNS